MAKGYLILIVCMFYGPVLFAQNSGSPGEISGSLIDAKSNHAIPLATVALLKMPDSTLVTVASSKEDGSFSFTNLAYGEYAIRCSYIGYQALLMKDLRPRAEKPVIDAGTIPLSSNEHMLRAVTIIAHQEKPLIEDDGDKLTYNVSESITNAGDIALDVLGKVPLVMVDASGNVTLNGQKPLILIDGKPSELGANAINDILQSLPADAIDKIEVMEDPPAKYQSEGGGGVINIVLKKGRKIGFTGRASVTAGTRNRYNGNVYLSYRDKKLSVSGIFSGNYRENIGSGYTNRATFRPFDTLYASQVFNNNSQGFSPFGKISIDYDITDQDNINFNTSLAANNSTSSSQTMSTNMTDQKLVQDMLERDNSGSTHNLDYGFGLNYTHKFKDPNEDISAGVTYSPSTNFGPNSFTQSFLDGQGNTTRPDSIARIYDNNFGNRVGLNLDYEKPLNGGKSEFSIGYRGDFNVNKRDYLTENFDPSGQQYIKNDTASNNFEYLNNVQALYMDLRGSLSSFRYRIGARLERTETNFDLYDNSSNTYRHEYVNLFPSLSLMKRFDNDMNLRLGYSMRVDRPGMGQLNPYVYYIDPYNISYGNPNLAPSTIQNFRLSFGKFDRDNIFSYRAELNYAYQNDITRQITTVDEKGVAVATYKNIATANNFGANIFIGWRPVENMNVSLFSSLGNTIFNQMDTFHIQLNNASSIRSSLNINYSFSSRLRAEVSMNYSKATTGQGIGFENFSHSLAVNYNMLNNRLGLNFKAIDPFRQARSVTEYTGPNFSIYTQTAQRSRNFALTLSWRFSRVGANNLNKQKRDQNDDRRQFRRPDGPPEGGGDRGGGGGGGFGGGGGGGGR